MSFLVWPPEVNSSLMFSGAGSAPMLAAAESWNGLATELNAAAQSFTSVTSGLAEQAWQGPAAAAMLQTATRYAGFLNAATAQAQTAAAQAQAVVSAFESAQAATVHPFFVAANRNELVQLVVSNLFGQNAPAIAAAEADYEEMWARDVGAMLGYHGGASAAAAALPSWSTAVQGLSSELSAVVSGNPLGAALTSAATSNPIGDFVTTVQQDVIGAINAPTEFLFGAQLIPTSPAVALGGNGATGNVPLTMFGGTEALVNASVGTGAPVPLLVDTGSQGLVIPFQKVGGVFGMLQMGLPTGFGISGYSGGLDYAYLTFNAPVNFGGGLVTGSTPVNVELFAWPTSIQSALTNGFTFQQFFANDGASGVLGIGPNATGPGPSIPTQHFANPTFNQGVLINELGNNPSLTFGGAPTNLGNPIATLSGAPITNLNVSVTHNGATTDFSGVPSIVDNGGVFGTIPAGLNASPGDVITVEAPNGTPLYSYTYNGNYFPTPISSGLMNTGALPFLEHPAYISNANNTLAFYS
ncbi:PecA family PE domain-processing aspartic protease [Mycobacterium saskatchewanense]|uniref:PPE family domain-containing protein n=1 Tax=Mycobacterium saskatchewanense TaxID=220927 RepID=A0AAJ3NP04_9MYCO|nr:PecA family PE domain-processing aspartic protease [Mycobacterium saskatchewanense]ORW69048.1 hypothetical protein AWC23_20055 [Mycobacterium saskatchewanense]